MLLSESDVELFAQVSGDVNPLHRSPEHARATPFGGVLAHGVLALLATLEEVRPEPGGTARLEVEFRGPVYPGVRYRASAAAGPACELRDGDRVCLSARWRPGPAAEPVVSGVPPLGAAAVRTFDDLAPGTRVSGEYGPRGLDALVRRFPHTAALLGPGALVTLLWSSYTAGMLLPGERCLLSGISVRCHPVGGPEPAPLAFAAEVLALDRRFGLLTTGGTLTAAGGPLAEVEFEAIVRTPAPLPSAAAIAAHLPPSERLTGRSAVVTGGSRGLGAAVALALAGQGCAVQVGHRGAVPDRLLAEAADLPGALRPARGDAADPGWSRGLAADLGELDFLVCSAAPPIRPLGVVPEHLDRFGEFLDASVRLVTAPLAELLPPLDRRGGRCLVVSSAALEDPPRDWPHYVTAKAALEGLVSWFAKHHPRVGFVVARPGLLRTEQTNTPGAAERAAAVEPVAAALVGLLLDTPVEPGVPRVVPDPMAGAVSPAGQPGTA
ncbi:SDR family NAD(P)-dependent oxidoreductase [Amycolatopsis sp. Hca4]|uniref:SDR family NAD(P)-dependent oxidoreductase n=1 Tax=Amycolatopsis sp. Hca4 TaxID=2742131 RepID=UPI0015915D45|nr:SDR family NAD(P)-dependent oxidoreductase [Amycolatopsis sp. Hca4]QKV80353.1 SDR family NAD(P)-dependent oxidoreductase [Amycolatopsis sp. Hca4]